MFALFSLPAAEHSHSDRPVASRDLMVSSILPQVHQFALDIIFYMTFTVILLHLGSCNVFLVTFSSHYIKSTLNIRWFPRPLIPLSSRILYAYVEQHKAHTPVELCDNHHLFLPWHLSFNLSTYNKSSVHIPRGIKRVPLMSN